MHRVVGTHVGHRHRSEASFVFFHSITSFYSFLSQIDMFAY
jgi:hypothetical protein